MLGVLATFLTVSNLFLVLDPSQYGLRVQFKLLTGLIEILPPRVIEFDDLELSLSGIAFPLLFAIVGWLAIQESAMCFSACHLVVATRHTQSDTLAILTRVTSGCANSLILNNRKNVCA